MTKKDVTPTENDDREQAGAGGRRHGAETTQSAEEAKGDGETEVKNAHATGDGSFGRADESLPDVSETEKEKVSKDGSEGY